MRGPAQTSEPIIQYLYQLIDAIAEGRLLIPRFQRPLVWKWDRQEELLRSVKDGIPMGAVMIWRTSGEPIQSRRELAGHPLPSPRAEVPREYLLDGLQRLSTLFAALKGPGQLATEDEVDPTTIGYNLAESNFVEQAAIAGGGDIVPLSVISDSVALLRFQRALPGPRTDQFIGRSDELAKAFREYKVPVIPIVSDELEVAARTFNLVNSQGAPMGEADMIHALTWSPKFELRDRLETSRNELLQPIGWDAIDFETILKVVKVEADIDFYRESVGEISDVLKRDPNALDRAFDNLVKVASFLREQCGIWDWALVPYSIQVVLLADALRVPGAEGQTVLLRDWFWLTTYGEMFAGLSGYRLERALEDIRASVSDGTLRWSGVSPFRRRPLPATADFRFVRIKALALQLARLQRDSPLGSGNSSFRMLADHKRAAMVQLIPRKYLTKENSSSPGNRFLCSPDGARELRQEILSGDITDQARSMHLIAEDAATAAAQSRWNDFVETRLSRLAYEEENFVAEIVARHPSVSRERRAVEGVYEGLLPPEAISSDP